MNHYTRDGLALFNVVIVMMAFALLAVVFESVGFTQVAEATPIFGIGFATHYTWSRFYSASHYPTKEAEEGAD